MKLIKLQDKFILVSDERLIHPDKGYTFFDGQVVENCVGAKKIIAGIPELPSIDFSDLKEKDCKEIGYVDVEKLANEWFYNEENKNHYENYNEKPAWIKGFKTAQSLSDKMFSLEQMKKYHNIMCLYGNVKGEEYIKSLQKNEWDVEVEMEQYTQNYHKDIWYNRPKITNNSIKVLRIL